MPAVEIGLPRRQRFDRGRNRWVFAGPIEAGAGQQPDRAAVLEWILHSPLPARDGQTTFELACEGQGERVVALLDTLLRQGDPVLPRG